MKNSSLYLVLLISMALQSCKKNESKTIATTEPPLSISCYKAIYEQDVIDLKLNALKDNKVSGTMEMILFEKPKKVGDIAGEFRGDTLFVSYTFTAGNNKEVSYKNPLAFLKRGNDLVLGNGEIETTMGASYFVKGTKIDFDNVKYKFSPVDCVEK